mmetsp:Transcript_15314/g.42358  ORF Transcript_15314/g.42358 Transcript_15314/m.42358 type:complete len:225 (-) Transcript_15314:985-1659(-)
MWKPGSEKPQQSPRTPQKEKDNGKDSAKTSSGTKQRSNKKGGSKDVKPLSSPDLADNKTAAQLPTSSAKKRLSGATMNMRFMKRKKETDEYESSRSVSQSPAQQRSRQSHGNTPQHDKATTGNNGANASRTIDDEDDASFVDYAENLRFQEASPSDMYGMQADLTGRRSFGNFNKIVEDAWRTSKRALETIAKTKSADHRFSKRQQTSNEQLRRSTNQYEILKR